MVIKKHDYQITHKGSLIQRRFIGNLMKTSDLRLLCEPALSAAQSDFLFLSKAVKS